ncbi:uncharacterized protein dsx-c73A [Tribolium castaneum]|uniref:Uncharacterized protein n=1 Tax=Tribolium castaneum TaxID=7070 RepID=D6W710_TRICA|nr:PREDICTED: uncharacterized protein LOC103313033 [Tribolium castaneum]EFA11430.1 hypothetical protein TcasGA2_TC013608 [Tribolium castaneum]|eukprot:XP_008193419.1 PREDICTED: uncharacterized protein LOC103313033 [Tribolium castaneum]
MRVFIFVAILCAVHVESQFWKYPQQLISTWLRQGKTGSDKVTTIPPATVAKLTTKPPVTKGAPLKSESKRPTKAKTTMGATTAKTTMVPVTTTKLNGTVTTRRIISTSSAATETSTIVETTTHEVTATTEEPRENQRTHDFYLSKREKPQVKIASNISQNLLPLPAGASAALVKPTKYHYYPHNQHIYLLPECAIQQVCNAVYVRLNWTQPLCACPSRYRDPCSASLNSDDQHTTELMIDRKSRRALTLVKTCEPTSDMRICRSPRDWSLLALQNIRTGKSHYLVICRCPEVSILEGPMSHDQPTYASVPGIRVYGMMCVDGKRRGRPLRTSRSVETPPFPWDKAEELAKTALWD